MRPARRYCRGCNKPFSVESGSPYCPQCGQRLTLVDPGPTVDLEATSDLDLQTAPEVSAQSSALNERMASLPGSEFDNYTIEEFLGKGGMAHVFRARHRQLQRPCAIKFLSPELQLRDPAFLEMFLAEARAAASVVHPNIVTVHNIGRTDSFHYIELEFIAGQSLQQRLQAANRLSPAEATGLLSQACAGLAEAHRCGLVHRDFKPSNILVTEYDLAKLSDFGLAKRIVRGSADETLAGTPYYMAPELFQGCRASRASDVYAVGVTFYYLVTGEFPFVDRSIVGLAEKHAREAVPDPGDLGVELPREARELVTCCLSKQPQDRPADGEELLAGLQSIRRAMRDLPSLVRESLPSDQYDLRRQEAGMDVRVLLAGGRSQRVFVEEADDAFGKERVVRIFSRCCEVRDDYLRRALEMNATICHGSLAIERIDGRSWFVMVDAHPRRTCDPEEIRLSVDDIARWADEVERVLTGQDRQ